MQSVSSRRLQAALQRLVPLPYDMDLTGLALSDRYGMLRPHDPEWAALIIHPISPAGLLCAPELREYLLRHAGVSSVEGPQSPPRVDPPRLLRVVDLELEVP